MAAAAVVAACWPERAAMAAEAVAADRLWWRLREAESTLLLPYAAAAACRANCGQHRAAE